MQRTLQYSRILVSSFPQTSLLELSIFPPSFLPPSLPPPTASSGASAVAVLAAIAKGETEFSLVGVPSDPYRREKAHDNGVYACTFARSGDKLATVGGDKYVRVWDAATGGQLAQFQGGAQSSMLDVAWTSDDRFLLAACSDKAVRVYDVSTQRERHTMTGHDKKVTSVRAFPSDKLRAASCAEDRSIKIWDLSTGFCKQASVRQKLGSNRWRNRFFLRIFLWCLRLR